MILNPICNIYLEDIAQAYFKSWSAEVYTATKDIPRKITAADKLAAFRAERRLEASGARALKAKKKRKGVDPRLEEARIKFYSDKAAILEGFSEVRVKTSDSQPIPECIITLLDPSEEVFKFVEVGRTVAHVSMGFLQTLVDDVFTGVLESIEPQERGELKLVFRGLYALDALTSYKFSTTQVNKFPDEIARYIFHKLVTKKLIPSRGLILDTAPPLGVEQYSGNKRSAPRRVGLHHNRNLETPLVFMDQDTVEGSLEHNKDEFMGPPVNFDVGRIRRFTVHNVNFIEFLTRLSEVASYNPPRIQGHRIVFKPRTIDTEFNIRESIVKGYSINVTEPIALMEDNVLESSIKFGKLRISEVIVYSLGKKRNKISGSWPKTTEGSTNEKEGRIKLFIPGLTAAQCTRAAYLQLKQLLDGSKGGELEILGDPRVASGGSILFVDPRHSEHDGFYAVREVEHIFGRGYFTQVGLRSLSNVARALRISGALREAQMEKLRRGSKADKRKLKRLKRDERKVKKALKKATAAEEL